MHDVCVIYSRKNSKIPTALEKSLSPEWSTWWDKSVTGDFRKAIENAIERAKCVIPVWSAASRQSQIVIDEANFAIGKNIPLLPVLLERNVSPPLGFGSIDSVELYDWEGELDHPGITLLKQKLRLITAPKSIKRPSNIQIGKSTVQSPTFFFSVSSHETRVSPLESIKALNLFGAEAVLVSAYDVANGATSKFKTALTAARSRGATVLLDSGNYESHRKEDKSWKFSKLHRVLENTPHDFAFCFDEMNPSGSRDGRLRSIIQAVERDSRYTSKPVLPIVHAPRKKDGKYELRDIPYLIKRVSEIVRPEIIAIPERELGPGLIAKARAVAAIREELRALGRYQPLHILGTGNPLSMAVLSAVGADCFDGLEWCRVVADASSSTLFHFEQYDFFAYQSRVAQSPIVRDAADSSSIEYAGKVLFHNMDFFSNFVAELRLATHDGKQIRFLSERLPPGSMNQLETAVPGIF